MIDWVSLHDIFKVHEKEDDDEEAASLPLLCLWYIAFPSSPLFPLPSSNSIPIYNFSCLILFPFYVCLSPSLQKDACLIVKRCKKKGPTVNKFKALVRYEQVYGNLEYRIVCLKTILATPSGLNSASFELETYDQAMTNGVFFTSGRVWLKRPGLGSGWGIVYWGSGYLSVQFVSIEADLSHWFVCEILFLIEFLNVISSHLTS